MKGHALPLHISGILDNSALPDYKLKELLALTGSTLQVDRCFLYVRHPDLEIGKIAFCWRKNNDVPDVPETHWENDTRSLPQEDPLIAAALAQKPSVYVEDVEQAPATVLNREFEAKTFGHRALVHAHLLHDDKLWGILQPCVFGKPRIWTEFDRELLNFIIPLLIPLVITYVQGLDLQKQ
jgi:GAF domain-containing protein